MSAVTASGYPEARAVLHMHLSGLGQNVCVCLFEMSLIGNFPLIISSVISKKVHGV